MDECRKSFGLPLCPLLMETMPVYAHPHKQQGRDIAQNGPLQLPPPLLDAASIRISLFKAVMLQKD